MLEWVGWAEPRVRELLNGDPVYQEKARFHNEQTWKLDQILVTLPEGERELILDYLNEVAELYLRKCEMAYEFGKQVGRAQRRV